MSAYIICYDPQNNVSIRTTSEKVADKLKKLYPHTIEIAKVSGHDCEVQRRNDCDNLTFNDYCQKYPVGKSTSPKIISPEEMRRVFNKEDKLVSIHRLLKNGDFDRQWIIDNFKFCKKQYGDILKFLDLSLEEIDGILDNGMVFIKADWEKIFEKHFIPMWFVDKHIDKLKTKDNNIFSRFGSLLISRHVDLDTVFKHRHAIGLINIYELYSVNKQFLIDTYKEFNEELVSQSPYTRDHIWERLLNSHSKFGGQNKDFILELFEFYKDPKSNKKNKLILKA